MSAYINAVADDANDILSGFRAFLKDGVSAFETATVLSTALFLAAMLNALV